MNSQNRNLEFAFQNTIPEFREQFSQNPNFVLTNIYDENHDCHIYLPKNKYRGEIARYDFRIIQIINDPENLHIKEIQFYHNHNHNGRIVPECSHSKKYSSESDVQNWTQVLNTYLRYNQQHQPMNEPDLEENFEDDDFFDPRIEDLRQDLIEDDQEFILSDQEYIEIFSHHPFRLIEFFSHHPFRLFIEHMQFIFELLEFNGIIDLDNPTRIVHHIHNR